MGSLFIVSAPSGGGKTSLIKNLTETLDGIEVSISHTTRALRTGERDGVDYFFITKPEFEKMISKEAFIEHALVFENLYGTSKAQITERLARGIDIVLDIDWQGAQQIKALFPDSVGIFVIPPSLEVLKERLEKRGRDDEAVIMDRMHKAQAEMRHYSDFDYLIVNDDFEQAAQEMRSIVLANRLRMERQEKKQAKLLSFLLS